MLLEEHRPFGEEVLSKDEAAVVTEALRAVVDTRNGELLP